MGSQYPALAHTNHRILASQDATRGVAACGGALAYFAWSPGALELPMSCSKIDEERGHSSKDGCGDMWIMAYESNF